MSKKYIVGAVLAVGALVIGSSAFAMTNANLLSELKEGVNRTLMVPSRSPKPTPSASSVACVAAAVSAREASLDAAISTQGTAVQAAYSARASALAMAYSKTTTTDIKAGVKLAWASFGTSVKNAGKDWKTAQRAAWATFNTAARACKDITGASDIANMGHEVSGN